MVAVVRRSAQVKDLDQLKADPHWVGVATWRSLLPELRDLPVSDAWRHDWHAFLDVVEDDGDFDEVQPKPREVQDQLKLMAELSPRIFDHFSMRIDELYGTGSAAAISLKAYKARGSRTWTSFGISASDGPWMWMGIRNLYSRAPRVWVDYYPLRDWRAKRRLEKPHLKLRRAGFELREGDYRYDKPHDELADVSLAAPEAVLDAFNGRLDALVRARVFDVELDRLRR